MSKKIKISNKEKLAELFIDNLEYAIIKNVEVDKMYQAIQQNLSKKEIVDEDDFSAKFNESLADMLLEKYDAILIAPNDDLFGQIDEKEEHLFESDDCKFYLDAGTLGDNAIIVSNNN